MTPAAFRSVFTEFDRSDITRLSDRALCAYTRIAASVCEAVRTVGSERMFGVGDVCRTMVRSLRRELNRRYVRRRGVARRAALLSGMYALRDAAVLSDDRSEALLDRRAERLIADCMTHPAAQADPGTLYPILHLVAACAYGPTADDPQIGFLHGHLSRWAATLDGSGRWPDVSDAEALGRIALLDRCTCLLLDDRYRATAVAAYASYCVGRRLCPVAGPLTSDRIGEVVLEYDLILGGTLAGRGDEAHAARLAARLERHIETLPAADDDALLCRSVVVADFCRTRVASIEDTVLCAVP